MALGALDNHMQKNETRKIIFYVIPQLYNAHTAQAFLKQK